MIYLASPYSHRSPDVMEGRYNKTLEATAALVARGEHIWSTIVHRHPLAKLHNLPTDAAFWKNYNADLIWRADEIYVLTLPGWMESEGVQDEIVEAKLKGILLGECRLKARLDPPTTLWQ